jgi:Zn-dependent M28 family amino/carboxypeptidase
MQNPNRRLQVRCSTRAAAAAALLAALACRSNESDSAPASAPARVSAEAEARIDAVELLRRVAVLASDRFEGRAPGSAGEKLTLEHLEQEFRAAGAEPGNPDGTFTQRVPLVGFKATPDARWVASKGERALKFPDEYVAVSRAQKPLVEVDAPLVFVGYGVEAPEYGWNDYKDVSVAGKVLVMLVNDPAVPDANDPSKLDEEVFGGRAMTYYGRWTYKYEIAAAKGAVAAILVHETGPAGYPYEVVSGSWGRENFDIARESGEAKGLQVEGWIRDSIARELFADAGLDFEEAKRAALSRDFKPLELGGARAKLRVENALRTVESRNVIAKVTGSSRPDEYVVYTAHWDHLGRDEAKQGDGIYNGAVDNATGTSGLVEMAQAFASATPRPERTVLFLAVTAEEKGLLGSKWYAQNPLYPLEKTLGVINMDGLNTWGRTRDVISVGMGNSTLHDTLAAHARDMGRVVLPDDEPEKGFFYRSDHFEFAKLGVPGLHAGSGMDYHDRPAGWGQRVRDEYTANDYHKPSDEIRAEWDLSGAVEDLRLFFRVGHELANTDVWPTWSVDAEFRAVRERRLAKP